jgi:hypothetical protein
MSTELAALPQQSQKIIVSDPIPVMDTGMFEHMQRIARLMAESPLLPQHLRGTKKGGNFIEHPPSKVVANSFLVVNQAMRWQMDPFALAGESYEIGGKLAYQGKVIQALVNKRAGLINRLSYKFTGEGPQRTVTVSGTFEGETEVRTVSLSVAQAKTSNEMWTKDPDQKLVYSATIKWARRFASDVVLGVLTDDDLERMAEKQRPQVTVTYTEGASKSDRLAMTMETQATPVQAATEPEVIEAVVVPEVEQPQEMPSQYPLYLNVVRTAQFDQLAGIDNDIKTDDSLTPKERTDLGVELRARADALKKAK